MPVDVHHHFYRPQLFFFTAGSKPTFSQILPTSVYQWNSGGVPSAVLLERRNDIRQHAKLMMIHCWYLTHMDCLQTFVCISDFLLTVVCFSLFSFIIICFSF